VQIPLIDTRMISELIEVDLEAFFAVGAFFLAKYCTVNCRMRCHRD